MPSTDEEPSFEIYVGDLLNFMRYSKIWRPDTFSKRKNILVVTLVAILLTSDLMLIISACIDFKNASNDLTSFATYTGPLCLQCIGLIKWSYCIWRVNEISNLIGTLERCHYFSMKINNNDLGWEKYRAEMTRTRTHYLRFLYGWLWLCMYGVLHWCSNPLILEFQERNLAAEYPIDANVTDRRVRKLPYLGWKPWDVNGDVGYTFMYIVQFIGGISSAIGSITYDVFYISSLMIVCAQLRYLNYSLVDESDVKTILKAVTASLDFERKLKNCVNHHSEILTFLNSLEVLASPAMFVQCLENIIVLCMVSLEASTVEVNTNVTTIMKLWSMLEYFLSVIAQLFVYCYYATKIRTLGLQIADSVYLSSWEQLTCDYAKTNENHQKTIRRINHLVQFFIFRAQRSIVLTGGPFYVLSLQTFKSVVGIAMSNSVILRQVVQDQT